MGARAFCHTVEGYSASECFNRLVEDALECYGNEPYNGTISTCSLGNVRVLANEYSKKVEKMADKIIEDDDNGNKRVATCLDLGRTKYEVFTVQKKAPKIRKKAEYRMKYVVCSYDGLGRYSEVESYDTKKEADDRAIKELSKNPKAYLRVKRYPVNVNCGDDDVTGFSVTKTDRKSKPKSKSGIVKEVHKYIFYGWASE